MPGGFKADQPMSVEANGPTAGPPQGEVSPLREAATRAAARSHRRRPKVRSAPSGRQRPAQRRTGPTVSPPGRPKVRSPPRGQRPAQRRSVGAIIVDLDGTMVDTLGDFEVALNRTLAGL